MKVNSNRDISFKGFYNNKALKKGLEFAADNGALFAASTTLCFSMFARPASIMMAPHTDKENKIMACAKSITSSISQFFLTLLLSKPIAGSIEKIGKNPQKYLKPETIKTFQNGCKEITESKSYEFATQMFKLGVGMIVAMPKAILTAAGMPFILEKVFHKQKPKHEDGDFEDSNDKFVKHEHDFDDFDDDDDKEEVSFKGKERLTRVIGKTLDNKKLQKVAEKQKDSNFVMHIVAATDTLTTATFIHETFRSDDIEEKRKKALIYNAGFSTGLSIVTSYIIDSLTKKPTEKFIENFKKANRNGQNLDKQLKGIKVAKPIVLVGCVYYMIIPFISTILAEIADHDPRFDIPHKHNKKSKK